MGDQLCTLAVWVWRKSLDDVYIWAMDGEDRPVSWLDKGQECAGMPYIFHVVSLLQSLDPYSSPITASAS